MNIKEIREEYIKSYDEGILNHFIRLWFYLQRGLSVFNEFKYVIAGIFAVYYTFQFNSYLWLILIFALMLPLLVIAGWFHVHKMAKALEWANMMFSTYFARHNVNLAEKNIELLEEILKELKNVQKGN